MTVLVSSVQNEYRAGEALKVNVLMNNSASLPASARCAQGSWVEANKQSWKRRSATSRLARKAHRRLSAFWTFLAVLRRVSTR